MSPTIWAVASGVAAYFGAGFLLEFLTGDALPSALRGYIILAAGIGYGVFVYRSRKSRAG